MVYFNPSEITYRDIENLPDIGVVRLVNLLIKDEGERLRLPANQVRTTLAITDPDGGIDAITDAVEKESSYFPRGSTVWQFKKSWPGTPQQREAELTKPAVQEMFAQGSNYIMVVGHRTTPHWNRKREEALRDLAREHGCTGEVRIYEANLIAGWASTVPAARFEFHHPTGEFIRADQALRDPVHATEFEMDAGRQTILSAIKEQVFSEARQSSYARIEGEAGIGKSRLALEIVRDLGLESIVLYSQNVPSNSFFTWVVTDPRIQPVVIVDECDETDAIRLEQWVRLAEGRLTLVSVGPMRPGSASGQNIYVLPRLEQAAVEQVIRSSAPTLDDMQVRRVAETTKGYLKMTIAVAGAVARGATSMTQMRDASQIRHEVTRIMVPGDEAHDALAGVALLTRLGWKDELEAEGRAVAEFLGLGWNAMRNALLQSRRRGLVVERGRYLYVSPELLALWLAADIWGFQADRAIELLDTLTSEPSKQAMLDRLAQLGDLPGVRGILGGMLNEQGFFRDIESLDQPQAARLFSVLAKGVPEAALATLQHIVDTTPLNRLKTFGPGRRHVLWALEKFLPSKETFFSAARVVRRLAEAENESVGNSATGIWQELFLTFLGQTEVPASERVTLATEVMDSDSLALRMLALDAVASALQGHEVATIVPEATVIPRSRWRPKTWGEVSEYKRQMLTILDQGFSDREPEVRKKALQVFLDNARWLVEGGMAEDAVSRFVELSGENEEEDRNIWEHMMEVLNWSGERLTEQQRETLERNLGRFYGDSLADRIKRYVGRRSSVDWSIGHKNQELDPNKIASELAEEALTRLNELRSVLPWLTSPDAENAWIFARRLGQLDTEHIWLEPLLEATRTGNNAQPLSLYLSGRAEAGEQEWRENLLDKWSEDEALSRIVFEATRLGASSERGVTRLLKLVDKQWVKPDMLRLLGYGAWAQGLPAYQVEQILRRILADPSTQATGAAALILIGWVQDKSQPIDDKVKTLIWEILERPSGWNGPVDLEYEWEQLAKILLPGEPARLARLILMIIAQAPGLHHGRVTLLSEALAIEPAAVWQVIGEALLRSPSRYYLTWALEESGFISQVPLEILKPWLAKKKAKGAQAIAVILKPGGEQLSELVRLLISEYGDQVGGTLAGNFFSGGFMGSEAEYFQQKLNIARRWQHDEDAHVREWAFSLARSLDAQIKDARLREEEENIGL
ncbi:MAG: hypothetical protein IVW55_00610 [Chloroflexi bacterium]|nr:hypothetical protein [Chloroflexota bacterium]